jgi:hypothetical protein
MKKIHRPWSREAENVPSIGQAIGMETTRHTVTSTLIQKGAT